METDSLFKERGNFKELRNMWSTKARAQGKPLQPTLSLSHPQPEKQQEQKELPRARLPVLKIPNNVTTMEPIKKEPSTTPKNERTTIFESVERLPSIEENIFLPVPPPPSILFQHQAQTVATLKNTVTKMGTNAKKNVAFKEPKNAGIHHWNIARHVFRSGLIFNRRRRASDTIVPLLMKTHQANHHSRTNSIGSTFSQTPFESLIDYITYDTDNEKNSLTVRTRMIRSASDTSDCIRRNKLDDSIFHYEMVLRHLKNYEQFMTTYPVSSTKSSLISSKQLEQSVDSEPNSSLHKIEQKFLARTSIPNRKTQSLSRNIGRTFSEFIMNDLFLSSSRKSSLKEQRCFNISHASSQTDITEPIHDVKDQTNNSNEIISPVEFDKINLISNEEAKAVLNDLDTMLDNSNQESPITPNSEVNVIVVNPPTLPREEEPLPMEKVLMQRLFEGKKTAYSPDDLNMKTLRLPDEMLLTYAVAKRKCFFDTEELIYVAKMIKISRRGYSQHMRMVVITTERLYNITKRNPYPKEGAMLKDILGLTCTPYKDGFVCVHTRETHEDRGDWLIVLDHPCEFVTYLFLVLGRENNDDDFLKFKTKFNHCRRSLGEGSTNDCTVEARLAESFSIKKTDYDVVTIFTP